MKVTPAAITWDEISGHVNGGGTPGGTLGLSTRIWEPTSGTVTPGRETPSHDKMVYSRSNRWDETRKAKRGNFRIFYFVITNLCH